MLKRLEREQQDRDREFEQDRAETMGISQGQDDTPAIVGDGSSTHHAPKFVDGGKVRHCIRHENRLSKLVSIFYPIPFIPYPSNPNLILC